ncbi:MAG: ABC transporter ATP-binding protein [Deltaproteobacteria bacterium]|nr:ABC transporter ATP-binding protein [Deltaproteobacteria bacterium]
MISPPPPAPKGIIRARGVSKRFGDRMAVDGLDLDVPAGCCFGLLGPNGAGKTTTLRMLYGVTRPTSGRIEVFGLDVATHSRTVRARLGVTLQESVLIEALTPVENLMVFGRYHLMRDAELRPRIDELIDFLQLGSHRDVPVRNLSGGFKRRLAVALSLVARPQLLILDEPTTGLDPAVRLALWTKVRELRDHGTTVLVTTHYMDEAERLCDRVAIMAAGAVLVEGEPRELISRLLARDTVEIEASEQEAAQLLSGYEESTNRMQAGNRAVVHLEDAAALVSHIRGRDSVADRRLIVRPTNLEDVFLHLTGMTLEASA